MHLRIIVYLDINSFSCRTTVTVNVKFNDRCTLQLPFLLKLSL
jgi:hypothetical protein